MQLNEKPSGTAMSIPGGLALGAMWALGLTLALAAGIAALIDREVLREQSIGYSVMALLTAASFTGATVAQKKIRHQRLMMCMVSGVLYWGILLAITGIFFGGQYEAVPETGLMILCGSGLAAFLSAGLEGKGRRRKIF